MTQSGRWTIVEYGTPSDALPQMAVASRLSPADVRRLIDATGKRIAVRLGMASAPLFLESDRIRAVDVAGLVRIAPGIELEIAPKFLGDDGSDKRWREDFFFLATLSKHGKILASEHLRSGRSVSRDLPSLVAMSMVEMQNSNRQRPLRTYRHSREFDFALDGDVDPESIVLPSPDGFEQEHVRYDRRNIYNATIQAAIRKLQHEVRDPSIRMQLSRMSTELGPQSTTIRNPRFRTLPRRARRWQDLYDLSVDVLEGLGLSFDPRGAAKSPGYVVSTWQVWEDVLTIAARLGFGDAVVRTQKPLDLGKRVRVVAQTGERLSQLTVTPDIRVNFPNNDPPSVFLDAKYRTRASAVRQRIDEADIYESLAFAQAGNVSRVALLYPAVPGSQSSTLGSVTGFETIIVGDVIIHGLQVEMRGISRAGGLRDFAKQVAAGVVSALHEGCGAPKNSAEHES